MKKFYAVFNYYGNQVCGHETLHVFNSDSDRKTWIEIDEMKREKIYASHYLAQRFNASWNVDITYFYHCENGAVQRITRHDYMQYIDRETES